MVDIAKYTIGRQRPHFFDVCKPNVGYKDCLPNHEYITKFECTGDDQYRIHEAQLSFYSGHSAFSFYAAWYTSVSLFNLLDFNCNHQLCLVLFASPSLSSINFSSCLASYTIFAIWRSRVCCVHSH